MHQNVMGSNIIITEPSSNLRALGRNALAGKWKLAVITALIYMLCIQIPPVIFNALFGVNIAGDMYLTNYNYTVSDVQIDAYSSMYNVMPEYSPLSGVYLLLVSGPLELGITLFFLAMFRRQTVVVTDLFLGFERFGKALGLMLFQSLFIFLWSLLFVIPGIIAAIRYSQAFFIMADDPDKGIRQCMDESKMMMKGNKAKYFCLGLSFIGWLLLAGLVDAILTAIAENLGLTGVPYVIISIIGGLFMVPVSAYMYSTFAGFYEILAGHLIKETKAAPVSPGPIPSQTTGQTEAPEGAQQTEAPAADTPKEEAAPQQEDPQTAAPQQETQQTEAPAESAESTAYQGSGARPVQSGQSDRNAAQEQKAEPKQDASASENAGEDKSKGFHI